MENREKDNQMGNQNTSSKPTDKNKKDAGFNPGKGRAESMGEGGRPTGSSVSNDLERNSGSSYQADQKQNNKKDLPRTDKNIVNKSQPSGQQNQDKDSSNRH